MPNPRYIVNPDFRKWTGEPTVELLEKMAIAKESYWKDLIPFCRRHGYDPGRMYIEGVYLIGSHATEDKWHDDTSDLDLKLVAPEAPSLWLHHYKNSVLNLSLKAGKEKRRWIDLYFAPSEGDVLIPRWNVTDYWAKLR